MNLYVIGPVTGIEDENRHEFASVKAQLESAGHDVVTPFQVVRPDTPHEEAMLASINCLTRYDTCSLDRATEVPHFDGVAMLDGWEQSEGARLEKQVAEACGISCKPWREWL